MPVWSVQTEKGMCVSYNTRDGWRAVDEDVELPARFEMRRPAVRGAPEVYMGFEVVDGVPLCIEVRFSSGMDGRGVRASDPNAAATKQATPTRALMIGDGDALAPALGSLAWLAGLLLVFVPLSVRAFRKA